MKRLTYLRSCAALAWALASPAWAASPAPDGTCGTGAASTACPVSAFAATATSSITVSTTAAAGCLVVFVSNSDNAKYTVSSLAQTSGVGTLGAFTQRSALSGVGAGADGSHTTSLEEWYAPYTAQLSSAVITVTMSHTVAAGMIQGMAVTGAYGNGCAFDPASSPPIVSGAMTASGLTLTQTTTQADDLLFSDLTAEAYANPAVGTFGGVSGSVLATGTAANGACCSNSNGANKLAVSSPQSSFATVAKIAGSYTFFGIALADALTAG